MYPVWLLRIWDVTKGRLENKWMDEHVVMESGSFARLSGNVVDDNRQQITWWTEKHNRYATREMVDLLNKQHGFMETREINSGLTQQQESRVRFFKDWYTKLPILIRAQIFFFIRYVFQFGFLDGKEGFIFHALQCGWYRFLVDVKVWEVEKLASREGITIKQAIARLHPWLGL